MEVDTRDMNKIHYPTSLRKSDCPLTYFENKLKASSLSSFAKGNDILFFWYIKHTMDDEMHA